MRALLLFLLCLTCLAHADQLLVEAESFDNHGGWKLDTQFIDEMGSPYLLAHGLGTPVADATKAVTFPAPGEYHVFVRTKDWVARWDAEGQPGKFQVLINGTALEETFGTVGKEWFWHRGGTVTIKNTKATLSLHDLTGFDGRCDALYFSTEDRIPPTDKQALGSWRKSALNLPDSPVITEPYDLVVVGGGYSGMGSALSAARAGCRVALVQNRPVLGGNGSSEIRVWAMGNIRRGKFPRVGEIIEEFADKATKSPGRYGEFGDAKKEALVRAEKNIDLFLNHHAHRVHMDGERIASIEAFDTRTSEERRFKGRWFVDCTGHGTIGTLAGADTVMEEKGRMGMSNMWRWDNAAETTDFPQTPWALDLEMEDFPYPKEFHGQWFWESGFDKDPLNDAEGIRDWNLRAVFGAFNAMKNRTGAEKHEKAILTWIAYIGGPRESRRLLGDVILEQEDVISKRDFPDGCVPSTWSIDLHYPKKQYSKKFPDNPFISIAVHDRRVDRSYGYPVPYRCFYSRNIPNLFMGGRCISVSHEALGTVRVMKTCGMMGEVVGKAAALCAKHACDPSDVYNRYLAELLQMLQLPGKAHRDTVNDTFTIPEDALEEASPHGPMRGLDPKKLGGIVIDDRDAKIEGKWTKGEGLKPFVGFTYRYASADSGASMRFSHEVVDPGKFDVRIAYQPHENRGTRVPIQVIGSNGFRLETTVDMTKAAPLPNGFLSIGAIETVKGSLSVIIGTAKAGGTVHADAVQFIPVAP